MTKPCLTPGTVWQFSAYGQPFSYRNGPARVVINLEIRPPAGKGGVPYDYPSWYRHGWSDALTPAQADELRDAVHDAIEPIIGRLQGNPAAALKVASDTTMPFGLPLSDTDLTRLYEGSKVDALPVGSEVRQLVAEIRYHRGSVPIAYLLTKAGCFEEFSRSPLTDADKADGWTETPLYARSGYSL